MVALSLCFVGTTSFSSIYRVCSVRAGFESGVSLPCFSAFPCRTEHTAGTHDYLLNGWMDGSIDQRKAECELSIVSVSVLQRKRRGLIDQSIYHLSSIYLPSYLSIIYLKRYIIRNWLPQLWRLRSPTICHLEVQTQGT